MADPERILDSAPASETAAQSQPPLESLPLFPTTTMLSQSSSQAIHTDLDRKQQATEDTMDGDDEDSGDSEETESASRNQRRNGKTGKRKLDRSKLRKGKWTVEEEEYTSRIIHYFGIGLLTLPEGATLRSYLADKLNCDPMRITKKYAGASCLGRRVYQFQNRMHPTVGDIQVAKTELDHLEQRFRARAAGEVGGELLPSSVTTSQAIVGPSLGAPATTPAATPSSSQAVNPLQTLLLSLVQARGAAETQSMPPVAELPQPLQQQQPYQIQSMAPMPMQVQSQPPLPSIVSPQLQGNTQLLQLLLATVLQAQSSVASSKNSPGNTYPSPLAPQSGLLSQQSIGCTGQATNSLGLQQNIPNLASLSLLYSQLAASQPQPVKPQQVQAPAPSSMPSSAPTPHNSSYQSAAQAQQQRMQDTILQISQAQQLQYQIQQHQNKLQLQLAEMHGQRSSPQPGAPATGFLSPIPPVTAASMPVTVVQADVTVPLPKQQKQGQKRKSPTSTIAVGQKELKEAYERHIRSQQASKGSGDTVPAAAAQTTANQQQQPRTEEDKAAGNALLGFLLSLRQSYEDALRSGNDSSHSWRQPARVSDDSNADSGETNQPESSIDDSDWNSDKKTDPSSGEDSDKEDRASAKKAKVSSHDITQKNSRVTHEDTRRHCGHSKHGDNNRQGTHRNKGDNNRQGAHSNTSGSSTN